MITVSGLQAGISFIFGKLIKTGQVPAGTVDHEAQKLLEKFKYLGAFFVFAHGTEESFQKCKYFNAMQIGDKQAQPGSAGQSVGSRFDSADFYFIFPVIFAIFRHKLLHLMGVLWLLLLLLILANIITHYPSGGGLFFYDRKRRLD
jgi:hypothetical protein